MKNITALIVTFNSEQILEPCIRSLRTAGVDDIVVADNMSSDTSVEVAAANGADVFRCGANVGFGSAMNKAAKRASGDTLLLMNPDCLATQITVSALAAGLEANADMAAVAPIMRYPGGGLGITGGTLPFMTKEWLAYTRVDELVPRQALNLAASGSVPGLKRLGSFVARDYSPGITPTSWISAYMMLVRSTSFAGVAGFDERFFMYFEDVDLCIRLEAAGGRVGIVGNAYAMHEESTATRSVGKRRLYAAGMKQYFAIHGTPAQRLSSKALARLMERQ